MILEHIIIKYKGYFTASIKYGLVILIPKFFSFFLIPFYWSFLSSKDYGIVSLIYLVQEFLGVLLTLGLESVIARFYHDWSDNEKKEKIKNIWTLYLISALLVSTLSYIILFFGFNFFFQTQDFKPFLHYSLIISFLSSFSTLPFSILRIRQEVSSFTKIQISSFFVTSAISVISLIYLRDKLFAFIISKLIGELLVATYWFSYMLRNFGIGMSHRKMKDELKYTLPVIFTSALNNLNVTLDRFILEKFVSTSSLGLFFLGKSFASNLTTVSQAIKMNFFPYIYKVVSISNPKSSIEKSNEVARVSAFSYFVLCVISLAFAVLSSDLIFLIGRKFLIISKLIPLFCFGYLIVSAESFLARGTDIVKKNSYDVLTYFIGITITICLMIYFIPRYNINGAIYGFIISSIINSSLKIFVAHRLYPRPFNYKLILYLLVIPVIVYFFNNNLFLANGIDNVIKKLLFLVLYIMGGLLFFESTRKYQIEKIQLLYEKFIK